jgi:hypothetical protein
MSRNLCCSVFGNFSTFLKADTFYLFHDNHKIDIKNIRQQCFNNGKLPCMRLDVLLKSWKLYFNVYLEAYKLFYKTHIFSLFSENHTVDIKNTGQQCLSHKGLPSMSPNFFVPLMPFRSSCTLVLCLKTKHFGQGL